MTQLGPCVASRRHAYAASHFPVGGRHPRPTVGPVFVFASTAVLLLWPCPSAASLQHFNAALAQALPQDRQQNVHPLHYVHANSHPSSLPGRADTLLLPNTGTP